MAFKLKIEAGNPETITEGHSLTELVFDSPYTLYRYYVKHFTGIGICFDDKYSNSISFSYKGYCVFAKFDKHVTDAEMLKARRTGNYITLLVLEHDRPLTEFCFKEQYFLGKLPQGSQPDTFDILRCLNYHPVIETMNGYCSMPVNDEVYIALKKGKQNLAKEQIDQATMFFQGVMAGYSVAKDIYSY